MKLCMFSPKGENLERGWPGRIEGDRVIQLAAQTLQSFFTGGGNAREHAEHPLAEVELRPPVLRPPSVRDFYAFEQHVKTARGLRGLEMVPEWYEIPAFYFSNPAAIYGPEDEIPYPDGSQELDYELELAAVIGAGGADRGLHGHERLVGARPPAARDEDRPRPRQGEGLRHEHRPGARHPRRAGRPLAGDGRAGERRGALPRARAGRCTTRGRRSSLTPLTTRASTRATSSARAPSAPAASSSTATGAGFSEETSSSWRSRGSACCGTESRARAGRGLIRRERVEIPADSERERAR